MKAWPQKSVYIKASASTIDPWYLFLVFLTFDRKKVASTNTLLSRLWSFGLNPTVYEYCNRDSILCDTSSGGRVACDLECGQIPCNARVSPIEHFAPTTLIVGQDTPRG
jgi:hypothetical protein